MHVVKSFPIQDDKVSLASSIFDKLITKINYPFKFDRFEFHIRDENKVTIRDNICIFVIDYNDLFLQEKDERGIETLILRLFFKMMIRETKGRIHNYMEEILANREMIKKGYGDDLFYYYYSKSLAKMPNIETELGWISFYPSDKYNAKMLQKNQILHSKIIDCLLRDLDIKPNFDRASRVLHALEKREIGA